MAVWDNGKGYKLYETDAKTHYFLEVPPLLVENKEVTDPLTPFMKLDEIGALPYISDSNRGWMIPVDKFPGINLFLDKIHELKVQVPPSPPRDPKHSYDHPLRPDEIGLLLLLIFDSEKLNQYVVNVKETLDEKDWSHRGVIIELNRLFLSLMKNSRFRDIIRKYVINRGLEPLIPGDTVNRYIFSDIDGLVPMYGSLDYRPLLKRYMTPPYPLTYWHKTFIRGVGIDFSKLTTEFNNEPPPPSKSYDAYYIALECYPQSNSELLPTMFRIYYFADRKPTYDEVVKHMQDPETLYYVISETEAYTIIFSIEGDEGEKWH